MNRIRFSDRGYRRRMQISQACLFVFVESRFDRYIYSRFVDYECSQKGIRYKVATAEELPQAAGGKQRLLKFFTFLRRSKSLIDDFHGKKTASILVL